MALVYNYKNINIEFVPNNEPDNQYKFQWIVYPLLEYKVFAPVLEDFELNIFQKTVLSILNKGSYEISEISNWTKLDSSIIKIILGELANKGLFNPKRHQITKKGKDIIEGTFSWFTDSENLRKDIRYIYQDDFTGSMIPVLLKKDDDQSVYISDNKLTINKKSTGKKQYEHKLIKPNKIYPSSIKQPGLKKIFGAINEHAKTYTSNSYKDIKKIPNAIQFVDEEPNLTYFATYIYSHQKNIDIENIQVADPFNIYEEAYWLKDIISSASKENAFLNEIVHGLVVDARKMEEERISKYLKSTYRYEIESEITSYFGSVLQDQYPALYSAVYEFFHDIKFYDINKSGKELKDAFRKSQIVLETMFKYIYEASPDGYQTASTVYNKGKIRIDVLKLKARKFNTDIEIPNWNDIPSNKINNPDRTSLRTMYKAAILASFYDPENKMVNIIKNKKDCLILFENVAEGRNQVGHKYLEIPDDKIKNYYEDIIDIKKAICAIINFFIKEG